MNQKDCKYNENWFFIPNNLDKAQKIALMAKGSEVNVKEIHLIDVKTSYSNVKHHCKTFAKHKDLNHADKIIEIICKVAPKATIINIERESWPNDLEKIVKQHLESNYLPNSTSKGLPIHPFEKELKIVNLSLEYNSILNDVNYSIPIDIDNEMLVSLAASCLYSKNGKKCSGMNISDSSGSLLLPHAHVHKYSIPHFIVVGGSKVYFDYGQIEISELSHHGTTYLDIISPGECLPYNGTSFSAAIISGTLSLLMQCIDIVGDMTYLYIKETLLDRGTDKVLHLTDYVKEGMVLNISMAVYTACTAPDVNIYISGDHSLVDN